MTRPPLKKCDRLVLFSPPWPLFNRPSIQLGALKAYLTSRFKNLSVESHHFYLKLAGSIGYPLYAAISERSWLAGNRIRRPAVSGTVPGHRGSFPEGGLRETGDQPDRFQVPDRNRSDRFRRPLFRASPGTGWVWRVFAICLCQLTAALFFIRSVRRRAADLPIVIGGSMLADETGRGLLRQFPEIDFAVIGEGEIPLQRLVEHLAGGREPAASHPIAGVITRKDAPEKIPGAAQPGSPTRPPAPSRLQRLFRSAPVPGCRKILFPDPAAGNFQGMLVAGHIGRPGKKTGCAFCNLNRQWEGYRAKSPGRAVDEIDAMTSRYRTLSVAFMDNLLPRKDSEAIFDRAGGLQKDFKMFAEIRADTSMRVLGSMRSAGVLGSPDRDRVIEHVAC